MKAGGRKERRKAAAFLEISGEGGYFDLFHASVCVFNIKRRLQPTNSKLLCKHSLSCQWDSAPEYI